MKMYIGTLLTVSDVYSLFAKLDKILEYWMIISSNSYRYNMLCKV